MRDQFRYMIADEPRAGSLSRFTLPPLLVFMAATFFQPWGYLLIALNAMLLNGPKRNREIALSLGAVAVYYLGIAVFNLSIDAGLLSVFYARYLFVLVVGLGLILAAFAYISQAETDELRRYLSQD